MLNGSDATLKNCIVWGNVSTNNGHQFLIESGCTMSLFNTCYSNATYDVGGTLAVTTNCITTNPSFVNAPTDFRIFGISPCADAGDDLYTSLTTDVRVTGFGRKLLKTNPYVTGTIDMGAYEYNRMLDPLNGTCANPFYAGKIAALQTICYNTAPNTLTSDSLPGGHTGTLEYKWQLSTTSASTGFTDISSSNSTTYSPGALTVSTWYRRLVRVSCMADWSGAVTSNSIKITVLPMVVGGTAVAASSSLCSGSSTTVSVSGYSGNIQWEQSANGSSGWGNVSGGSGATSATYTTPTLSTTTYYRVAVSNGACGTAYSSVETITVNEVPTVAAITGTTSVCTGFTTTLSCSTPGGVWSSSDETKATVNAGVVTGVSAGAAVISYTVTNGFGCSAFTSASVNVLQSFATPTGVTATPSTIQSGQSSNLNATSAGNNIYWYTSETGGSATGSSASGVNFSVSPSVTTTYYAEANSTQSFYINTLTANNSHITDHNIYTGDDRGGIAITASYYYYNGDNYAVRFSMPGLTDPISCPKRDGIFSDLGTGTLYTLHNGSSDPVGYSNTVPFNVTQFRILSTDLAIGASAAVTLSQTVSMNYYRAAIYAGSNFVILQNENTFYRVDIPSGTVTNMGSYTINRFGSENWATWGVAELNNGVYSVLYRESYPSQNIKRLNLSTGAITNLATFTNLSDLSCFTYSPTYSRWYFHYEYSSQFGGTYETAGYADGTHTTSSAGCPNVNRTPVTVTISNPPTVTTVAISEINATTATSGGNVTNQGGAEVTARGVCWNTSQNPTITNGHTTDGTGTGVFTSSITDLNSGTLYYVRAYATNSIGTSYGNQVTFTSYSAGTIGSSQEICIGSAPALFTSGSTPAGMPSPSYQWQSSIDNTNFSNIAGATSSTYQSGSIDVLTYFRRNATQGSVTLSSNTITISISEGIDPATNVTATPSEILLGQSSNLNATSNSGDGIKWYNAATGGTLLATSASGANYSVSPTASTTYYAQASPEIACTDNSLANTLAALNSNYGNIINQIPNRFNFTEGSTGRYIMDGGNDMYDGGNLLSTNNSSNFNYSDNSVISSLAFGTGGKYFTRKVEGLFVMAADAINVNWFKVSGDYGSDGWGNTNSSTFTVSVGCKTFNCFLSRVYNAYDPSINELFIIPANSSASHQGIANTGYSYHQLNGINASTRIYYLLYAGSNGSFISDTYAQNIATAFLTQSNAVINGSGQCPATVRTPVTVTVSSVPGVTTAAISNVLSATADAGGEVISDGGASVTERGVCWSTSQNPTISNSHTSDGTGTGSYSSSVTGLESGHTYYLRAYATNSMGTGYGTEVSFTTFSLGTFSNINKMYGDPPFTLTDPTSTSPGAFTFESSNTNAANISGHTVTITGAGTSTITATQAASGSYGSSTTSCTLTVTKADQTLTLNIPTTAPLNLITGGNTLTISASSSAGLTVTISINSSSTATGTLTPTVTPGEYVLSNVSNAGTIIFDASQVGNSNYYSAGTSQNFNVELGNQEITFSALPSKTYGDDDFSVSATGGASGNPVAFSSSNENIAICTGTNGTTIHIVGAGNCLITASQAGNSSWNAASPVSQAFTVNKATPVITFENIAKIYGNNPFTLSASSPSVGAFSYSNDNSSVATVSGNTCTIEGVGSSTLTASQAASDNYFAASKTASLTVGQASQSISVTAIQDVYLFDFEVTPITVTASSTSGLPVTLTIQDGSVATIEGTTLTSTGATGSVTVIANQAGNANYEAATEVTELFVVTKADQTITFDALPLKYLGDADFDLTASTSSQLQLTYISSNTNVVTIVGKTVHIVGTGTTNITVSQAGNMYYNAATPVMQAQVVNAEQFKNWTGSTSTDWNVGGNWDPSGVPISTDNLIIGPSANQPHITMDAASPALSNKLSIGSGATLTIDAAKALTVNGVLTNEGTLQIMSSESGTGSLITNSSIANTGIISLQRYITNGRWHLISSPVSGATSSIFNNDYLQLWDEPEAKWMDIIVPATPLNAVHGYSLWTMNQNAYTYTFAGTPYTGNQSKAITFTESPFIDYDGGNLLGNPYPSCIDWDGLRTTYGAVYYWDGSAYVSWNNDGSGSQYIPPMQGFFVVTDADGVFNLTNANRTHNGASIYYKSTENKTENSSLVLFATNGNYQDELYVRIQNEAQEGFELQNDAWKMLSNTAGLSQLWSNCSDGKLSIDVRPYQDVIQLGFTNDQSGNYSIAIKEMTANNTAILEDTKENILHNFINGTYNFAWDVNDDETRFKLHLSAVGIEDTPIAQSNIHIYAANQQIFIKGAKAGKVKVLDIISRTVLEEEISGLDLMSIPINLQTGVYLVVVINGAEVITKKIFIE